MDRTRTYEEGATNGQFGVEHRSRPLDVVAEFDRLVEEAYAALLEHARTFLRDILDALELRAVDIVANSIGGPWSVSFALVGAPPGVSREAPIQLWLFGLPLVGRWLGRLLLSNPARDSSRRFWGQILVAHPERLDDTLLDADVAHMRRNRGSVIGLMWCIVGVGGLRRHLLLGERWQALKVPTVFLWGERDAFMTLKVLEAWEEIAAPIRTSALPVFPTLGTSLGWTAPSVS